MSSKAHPEANIIPFPTWGKVGPKGRMGASCPALLTLLFALACSPATSDSAPDAVDLVADETAPPPAVTFHGRIVDSQGDPVPKTMLVLCGNVEGKEVCNQQFSADDGTFRYEGLLPGYTHLQVVPHAASLQTGISYGGASLVVDLPEPPATVDQGDIVLPRIEAFQPVIVADGGTVELAPLTLEFTPASISFPGLDAEGSIGLAAVADCTGLFGEEAAGTCYALHPWDTRLNPAAQVRFDPVAVGTAAETLRVFVNSSDLGGLYEVETTDDGGQQTFPLSELTWIVLKPE